MIHNLCNSGRLCNCFSLLTIKQKIVEMCSKLKTVERQTLRSEDRVAMIKKVMEDERLHQHRLDDTVGRVLAKQRHVVAELEEAHNIVKNLETDNMVRRGLSLL